MLKTFPNFPIRVPESPCLIPTPLPGWKGTFFPIKYILKKEIFRDLFGLSSLLPPHTTFRAQMGLSHEEFLLKFPIWEEFIGFLIINRTLIKQRNKFPSLSGAFWHLVIWVHKWLSKWLMGCGRGEIFLGFPGAGILMLWRLKGSIPRRDCPIYNPSIQERKGFDVKYSLNALLDGKAAFPPHFWLQNSFLELLEWWVLEWAEEESGYQWLGSSQYFRIFSIPDNFGFLWSKGRFQTAGFSWI